MESFKVRIEAQVYPTEDPEKVKQAIGNLYEGPLVLEEFGGGRVRTFKGLAEGLEALKGMRDILKRDRVRAAAHAALMAGLSGDGVPVYLNKQVAFTKHVSFCGPEFESPLGPITVRIEGEDPLRAVEWLTSRTGEER